MMCERMSKLPDTIWNRILTIGNFSDSSTASRIPLLQTALKVIQRSPITGAGLGTAAVQSYIKSKDHCPEQVLGYWKANGYISGHSFLTARRTITGIQIDV